MYLCVDVYYPGSGVFAAGVVFSDIKSDEITGKYVKKIEKAEDYSSGHFYRRELPVILELLREVEYDVRIIIIDGYVSLSPDLRPGLGAYLFNALGGKIPIIGVAKNAFRGSGTAAWIFRGRSRRPLYVTAAGMENDQAAHLIEKMHGPHRLPTLLKYVDRLSRGL